MQGGMHPRPRARGVPAADLPADPLRPVTELRPLRRGAGDPQITGVRR